MALARTYEGRASGWIGALLSGGAGPANAHMTISERAEQERARGATTQRMAEASGARPPVSAFEPFFREHERAVYACLWRLTGDPQTARDLTQETFLRAWRHFDQGSQYERPLSWLLKIATNLAISQFQRSRPTISTDALTDADAPARSDPTRGLALSDLVQRTLLELPPNQRAALVLREVYGFSCEEIGSMLGLTRDAVKMALFRGREAFRRHYLGKVDA